MMGAAETIYKLRMSMCLDQAEFARKLGISRSAICNYEKGSRKPKFLIIRKMRDMAKENGMDIPVEDFLT